MTETNDLVVERDVMVPMRDGIRLRTDVFRPASGGPHPVLLQRYPYSPRDGIMAMFGQQIARQGYAVVIQSCRGRFGSEGDFYPIHPDVDDSYDTVEWAAAEPWSDGEVGMYGVSYSGMTQWAAAIARPPHLVCLAPFLCTWDSAIGAWYSAPGVLTLGLALLWSAQMTAFEAERRDVTSPLPIFAEVARMMDEGGLGNIDTMAKLSEMQPPAVWPLFARRPLRDVEELRELAPWFRDWCDHPDSRDSYWQAISAAHHADEIDLPVLHVTGWYDYFTKGSLDAYNTLAHSGSTEQTRRGQRLIAGPWNHNGAQIRPDADPTAWMFFDFSAESPTMRFFAHHLKGEFPGYDDEPRVRIYVTGDNVWRDETEWPLARTRWTSYHLHGDGHLSTDCPGDERPDSYVYQPTDPAPGSIATGATYNDPVNLDSVATRPDVLVYTTDPLEADLEITGPVALELWASTSAPSTDFTAKLIEVFSDGTAVPLCQGVVRTSAAEARPGMAGAVYRHEIDLGATSTAVKAGHRLRLDVSSSEFPTYDLNPNTGRRITDDSETAPASQRVFHDALHPSRLILPIVPR
jgi:putative CocE/NonD family hydrolase